MPEIPAGSPEIFPRPFGKFTLQREAGRGGKGMVYEAVDTVLQRRVALKVSLRGAGASAEELQAEEDRFLLEARIGAFLPKHNHIIGVYEAGVIDGQRYLSTEYIEGDPMTRWRKNPNVTVGHQVRLLRDIALAMEHAHRHGVIHRDLKPSNILVDRNNQPHVTDFGLAKMVGQKADTAKSVTGKLWGTPAYMSPEHARGQEVGHRTDVYSMGVMLYEILTGHTPFRGPTSTDVLGKVVRDVVVAPSKVLKAGTLTPRQMELEPICMRALCKDPAGRQGGAKEFAEELTRWLDYGKTVRMQAKKPKGLIFGAIGAAAFLILVLIIVMATSKTGPSPEELAAQKAKQEEQARELKERMEREKALAAEGAAERARRETEGQAREEQDRLRKEMEARRRADEEAALREQARLEAQRREAEERARKAEEELKKAQAKATEPPPVTPPTSGDQPPTPPVTPGGQPGTTPAVPGTEPTGPVAGPAPGTASLPPNLRHPAPAPPTGQPRILDDGTLHWEAEDYSGGFAAVAGKDFHDTSPGNYGKYYRADDVDIMAVPDAATYVNYGRPGEWLHYRFQGGGRYEVEVRYLRHHSSTLHFEVDGVDVTGPVRLLDAAAQPSWATVSVFTRSIPEGEHDLRLVFDGRVDGVDYFRFRKFEAKPPPEAALLREAVNAIRDIFKTDYAKRAPADQQLLAQKLLQEGIRTEKDPVARYALFSEARDVAAQGGDVATMFKAVEMMERWYVIDAAAMKEEALNQAARAARTPEAARAVADAYLDLAEHAVERDDLDGAVAIVSKADSAARVTRDRAFIADVQTRAKEYAALRDEMRPVRAAIKRLEEKPDDPSANLSVGLYRCFRRNDWERGLPMLARGSDESLATVARKELEGADAPAQEIALGEAWKDLAGKKSGSTKEQYLTRALYWFEKALAGVAGLERLKVETQVEELYKALAGDSLKKGLVFWVEPGMDRGDGTRELAFGVKAMNSGATVLMDAGVKAIEFARSPIDYAAYEGVRLIQKEGSIFAWMKFPASAPLSGISGVVVCRGDPGLREDDFNFGAYYGRLGLRINYSANESRVSVSTREVIPPGKWILGGRTSPSISTGRRSTRGR